MFEMIAGVALKVLSGPLLEAYKLKLQAVTGQDKMAADLAVEEIKAEIESRKQAAAIILAEQGTWFTRLPRAIVQYSFAVFVAKVVVWDKVLGWGSTDPLTGDVGSWAGMLMAMWFGGRTIEKVAQIFKR